MKLFLAIILVISSSLLICSAHELSSSINSTTISKSFGESKAFNDECICRGQTVCKKYSIKVQTFPPADAHSPVDPYKKQRNVLMVTNTCPFCTANQILLDCSSFLPKNLLFPYCAVSPGRPLEPNTSWETYFNGTLLNLITVIQANFYCTT